jgi:hypothetical protein
MKNAPRIPDTAIFLGAGASKADGAPLQGELFAAYFSSEKFRQSHSKMDKELAEFFLKMFKIDVTKEKLTNEEFPTFEEVLGLTDLAVIRKEAFRGFDVENRSNNTGRLRSIAQYLVFLVAKVLDNELGDRSKVHRQLIRKLLIKDTLQDVAFVSTNYDILIDNALTDVHQRVDLDYGTEFRNFDRPDDWERPRPDRSVYLYKPHGSLNWLFCPACNELEITPKEKSVTRLISESTDTACSECGSAFSPIIVPPTFYKDMNNVFLSWIWNRTDMALRKVNHIVFCGYSFPDADIHIKYLLKRAQTNRSGTLRVTVVNHHSGKDPELAKAEKQRYERFFGPNVVTYTECSFSEFAVDPQAMLR